MEYDPSTNHLQVYAQTGDIICDVAKLENTLHLFQARNIMNGETFIIHIYPSRSSQSGLYVHVEQKILKTIALLKVTEKQEG